MASHLSERRDSRGRRIGYNWWREYNCGVLLDARHAREHLRESGEGLQMEDDEFDQLHPSPTLKAFLIANAGMNAQPEEPGDIGFPETDKESA